METGLYGIKKSNRKPGDHWGKNCFNSSFPTALACWMMDRKIPALYVHLEPTKNMIKPTKIAVSHISIEDVFNCRGLNHDDLEFNFESVFTKYENYAYDQVDGIDLVVAYNGTQIRPLEIKLTAFPDNSTVEKPKSSWGSELVIRSATTMYCAFGIYDSVSEAVGAQQIRDCFEFACSGVSDWKNDYEVTHKLQGLLGEMRRFEAVYYEYQRPILMQVLWKTKGKSPYLEDDAFQIIVWSDFAFEKLIADRCSGTEESMSRPMRAAAKMVKCIWDLSKSGKINLQSIYRELSYGNQNDKEFAVSGRVWREVLSMADFSEFPVRKDDITKIINPAYLDKLSPERRLDQTIFFTFKK